MPDIEEEITEQPEGKGPVWRAGPPAGRAGFVGLLIGLLCASALLFFVPNLKNRILGKSIVSANSVPDTPEGLIKLQKEVVKLTKKNSLLKSRLDSKTSAEPYIVVDTSNNKLYLKSGSKILRETTCSTGSYILLKAPTGQKWIFYTPRGRFRVLSKQRFPIWTKPDWAFVEEGRPVPPPNSPERFEEGVLGECALSFGHGYLIHGTLYQRFLGLPVTHGCIRLGDEDLRVVYKKMHVGSKIFIY